MDDKENRLTREDIAAGVVDGIGRVVWIIGFVIAAGLFLREYPVWCVVIGVVVGVLWGIGWVISRIFAVSEGETGHGVIARYAAKAFLFVFGWSVMLGMILGGCWLLNLWIKG